MVVLQLMNSRFRERFYHRADYHVGTFEVIMLPFTNRFRIEGLMDNYVPLFFLSWRMLYHFLLQAAFFLGLPKSLIEAGRIIGLMNIRFSSGLLFRLYEPAIAAMAILNGMNAWNNYICSQLLVVRSASEVPLTFGT